MVLEFIHIPKTAGKSVVDFMKKHDRHGYTPQRHLSCYFKPTTSAGTEKFTIIRNPYDRAISHYFWVYGPEFDLQEFKRSIQILKDIFGTQWSVIDYFKITNIYHFENLKEVEKYLQMYYKTKDKLTHEHYNKIQIINGISIPRKSRKYYITDEIKELIDKLFSEDFEKLGFLREV